MRVIGIPVSPGVVVGRAVVLTGHAEVVRFPIARERIDDELLTLQQARERSHSQLQEIRDRLANGPGHDLAPLFDAQLLILDDSMFLGRAKEIIRDERVNAAWAVHRAYEELCAVFATVEDPYLRERDSDLADVAGRVRMNLRRAGGWTTDMVHDVDGPAVLIADELTASLAAQMDWSRVLGFATDAGGRTHHTAILARSLKVPAVVGLRDLSRRVRPGTPVVINGTSGQVTIDPTPEEITEAQRRAPERRRARPVPTEPVKPAVTLDGVAIRLDANLERLEDVPALLEAGAEGVGLFRSEFLLAGRAADHLSEDQQFDIYRGLLAALTPRPVTIRTFDVDERAPGPWSSRDRRDTRPGLRGVRLSLARPELLKTQLRALLRAAPAGHLRVMFPFVTSVDEMRAARAIVREVEAALGDRASAPVPVGAMVEVPSAALAADLLAPEAAFFTVGTNDLIQYTLAVDRTDERVSDLYAPLHPAVIRLLRLVRRAATRQGIDASVCGEMASDPAMIALLVGLGFRAFSMTASAIPIARRIVQDLRTSDARRTAGEVLRLATADEVEQHLFEALAAVNRRTAPR